MGGCDARLEGMLFYEVLRTFGVALAQTSARVRALVFLAGKFDMDQQFSKYKKG